jgi:hypothetical protein
MLMVISTLYIFICIYAKLYICSYLYSCKHPHSEVRCNKFRSIYDDRCIHICMNFCIQLTPNPQYQPTNIYIHIYIYVYIYTYMCSNDRYPIKIKNWMSNILNSNLFTGGTVDWTGIRPSAYFHITAIGLYYKMIRYVISELRSKGRIK